MKSKACSFIVLLILFLIISKKTYAQYSGNSAYIKTPIPIILDTDPGVDDALAILLALNSPDIDLKAITVVAGNVTLKQGLDNTLKIVSLSKKTNIPVAGGASSPLAQKLVTAEFFHGKNGIGNVELPEPSVKADPLFAPDLIIELIHKFPNQLTLVIVGPETNIALAIYKDPSIISLVKRVVVMGGSITGGNSTAAAEANIFNDPEAARVVFNAGWALTMVGLNVTERTVFSAADLSELSKTHGPQNDFAVEILTYGIGVSNQLGGSGMPMHDVLAMGSVIDPSVISTEPMWVDIETRGELTRGETVASRHNSNDHKVLEGDHYTIDNIERVPPNIQVATEVSADRFIKMFISRIAGK